VADAVVVGGSVAALVTADAVSATGRPVELHLPGRGVGSGFLPVQAAGRQLELGPRLIELAYDDEVVPPPPLADYRPGPHGHRPYLALVQRLVLDLADGDLREIIPPELVRAGRRVPDFLLGSDLTPLRELLEPAELDAVAAEAAARVIAEGPAGLLGSGRERELWSTSFGDASRANHGATFHRLFIEAVAAKVLPGGSDTVIAALRRKIWLPLFHPATILDACRGSLRYRPKRPMHTVAGGGMGALVARLLERVRSRSNVTVRTVSPLRHIERAGTQVHLTYAEGDEVSTSQLVVGTGPEELFAALGVEYRPVRARTSLVWVDVDADRLLSAPSVLFSVDDDVAAYRVSESTAGAPPGLRTFTVELRHGIADDDLAAEARASLRALGIIEDNADAAIVRAGTVDAFTEPSAANAEAFARARTELDERAPGLTVVGGATAFAADAFNEQVVQGFRAAERLA
jgi:hypothetical protein